MRLVLIAVIGVFLAGYAGLVPQAAFITQLPVPLIAGAIVTAGIIYLLAKA